MVRCETKYKSRCPRCSDWVGLTYVYAIPGGTEQATSFMEFDECVKCGGDWTPSEEDILVSNSIEIASHTLTFEDDELLLDC